MLTYSKTLHVSPVGSVYGNFKDYFTVKGDVELSIDVDAKNYRIETKEREAATAYRLRVGPIRIASTGKRYKNADSCLFGLALYDKDENRVARHIGPFLYSPISQHDNINILIENGSGECYTLFLTSKTLVDAQLMKQIADSAYYFVIF